MRFTVVATLLSSVAFASAQFCAEAARFGIFSVSPTTVAIGDTWTIKADFTCARSLGFPPFFTDYYIEVPVNNNGFEPDLLVARRTWNQSADTDEFTAKVPAGFFFPNASFVISLVSTYNHTGSDGSEIFQTGSTSQPINITSVTA